ncbi:MAG: UbiD family decarboxylase [Rhodospirillales bacterium]|jgi:UbiD family decarboxylase|nr:UbiD family decarboxylase [Rhodospirillales bacterium]
MEFRQFLAEQRLNGGLDVVAGRVSCREIPARIQAEENGRNRALVFENIADYPGAVVGNAFGSWDRINRSVGAGDSAALFRDIDGAIAAPKALDLTAADESDYVITANPNLKDHLPPIIYSEHDSTPYITSSVILVRHPETGRHHLCFVRLSVQDGNEVLFNPRTFRIKEIADKTVAQGETLEIVALIGAPAEISLLGGLSIPDEVDELEFLQAWGGDTLKFYDRDLPVPATTEMVLFGTVRPGDKPEGPFGDMRGFYITNPNPTCVVNEIWQRKDVQYHSVSGGMSHEHIGLVSMKAHHDMQRLKSRIPGFVDYQLPQFAAAQLGLITVSEDVAKDDLIQELRKISLVELFVLLNEDTNANKPEDVLWALTQRANQADDYDFNGGNPGAGITRRTVIDATAADLSDWQNRRVQIYE